MDFTKSLAIASLLISVTSYAKINFDLALLRGTQLIFQPALALTAGQKPIKVYQDDATYIEAELADEHSDTPRVKLTVSTRSENGMFLVRGMPEITASLEKDLVMSSIQCNSPQDNFVMLIAMSKAE